MCGIAGQVRVDGRQVDAAMLARMCSALEHRGPDSRGLCVGTGAALGIQRLRVIDLETGDQPIFNEDRSVAVVLNGEIYNHREIRERLRPSGHRFATRSDTEAIVHLYEEEGPDCVRSLHGMFAFALWDERRKRLVLARDRVGKKPLFFCQRREGISFASELAALLEDREIQRTPDHSALDAYLAFRWVPAPRTAFEGVDKLPPASVLVYEGGRAVVRRYWSLDYSRERKRAEHPELEGELRDQIRRAVRRRMIADVPLGAFLSGGIDSSAVVAAMAEASPRPVRTFSIGFTSDRHDELPMARMVAQRFGTDHEELVVEPSAIEVIPKIVRHHGEPFADSSAIPSFYVAEMARRSVTVALNGDGGDEAFAGYTRYVSNLALHRLGAMPGALRGALGAVGRRVPPSGRIDSWRSRARRLAEAVTLGPAERHTAYMTHLNGLRRDELYTQEHAHLVGDSIVPGVIGEPWRRSTAEHPLDRMLDVDVQTYLPDDLLAKMDVATMAFSLEARSPFLDHELMQFAASLPPRLKAHGRRKKVVLRSALRGWLPDPVLDAPKQGFTVPLAEWLRRELRPFTEDVLLDARARDRGRFRHSYVQLLLDQHFAHRRDHSQAIWTPLMLELWQREFVDANGAPPVSDRIRPLPDLVRMGSGA
jgi:asparagine synthase (glutamine-hydrolysing)